LKLGNRIDTNGLYVEPVMIEQETNEAGDVVDVVPADVIIDPVPEGFFTPKWDGVKWIDAKPQTEILAFRKSDKIAWIKLKARDEIEKVAPIWKQLNLVRGGKAADPIFVTVDGIRTKSDDLEALVNAAATVADIDAIVW
jgi:hypothetical protein